MKNISCVLCAVLICIVYGIAYDDGFEAHVDRILDAMADEDGVGLDDPYGDPYTEDPYRDTTSGGRGLTGLTELSSIEEIDTFVSRNADIPAVIGYFDMVTSYREFDIFEKLGMRDNEHYRYGYVISKAVLEEKRYSDCAVTVHMAARFLNPYDDEPEVRYPNKSISDIVTLKTFVRQSAVPLVGEMTPQNEKLYRNTRLPVVTVFALIDHLKNPKGFKYLLNRVRKVAKLFRGKLNFNIADARIYFRDMNQKYEFEETYIEHAVSVGLRDRAVYYAMPQGDFSVDALRHFVQDFQNHKLDGNDQFDDYLNKDEDDHINERTRSIAPPGSSKSTKKPKKSQKSSPKKAKRSTSSDASDIESDVIVLTEMNAKSVLSTPNADILVDFYAPWCGHCQQLEPELRKTAAAFKEDSGVIIAAMDATAHAVPAEFTVVGYPTLYFIPANSKKQPKVYTGARKAAEMIRFLDDHRTAPLDERGALYEALLEGEQRSAKGQSTEL